MFARMIKDVLSISMIEIDVERLFFMTRDVMHYCRNCFHDFIIENIMIFKKTHQVVNEFSKSFESDNQINKAIMNVEKSILLSIV